MDSFRIESCTISDGPSIGRNNVRAFWTDLTWVQIWRGRTREYVAEQAAKRGRSNLLLNRAHRRCLKAVDAATGEVVGYARWVLPEDEGCDGGEGDKCHALWKGAQIPGVSEDERKSAEEESKGAVWTFTGNHMDGIDAPIEEMDKRLTKGKKYLVVDYLCVPPEFRRRGIALALIKKGLEEAERLGLDTFVMAMKAGVPVYQKAGFILVDQVLIDASDRGGDKDYGGWFLEKRIEHGKTSDE